MDDNKKGMREAINVKLEQPLLNNGGWMGQQLHDPMALKLNTHHLFGMEQDFQSPTALTGFNSNTITADKQGLNNHIANDYYEKLKVTIKYFFLKEQKLILLCALLFKFLSC